MKLNNLNVKDLPKFFDVINTCKGRVILVSDDMMLNLKSELTKYVSFAELVSAGSDKIPEIEILAYEREDVDKLLNFAIGE